MSYSYPISFPTVSGIRSIVLRTMNSVGVSRSPFTYKEQVFSYGGQMWEADIVLSPMNREQAEEWVAFLVKLKGQTGTFLLGDPSGAVPRGSAATNAGTPVVYGSNQSGGDIEIEGLPISTNGYLLAGDYIQLGTGSGARLHKVLTDVDTDANGRAIVDIYPNIRVSPSDQATVLVSDCKGVFRLGANETSWSISEALRFGISFEAKEALA